MQMRCSEQVFCVKLPWCVQAGLLSLSVVISVCLCLYLFAENERLDCSCSDSVNVDGYWSSSSSVSSSDLPQRLAGIAVCISLSLYAV
jgi:hypothetical protein